MVEEVLLIMLKKVAAARVLVYLPDAAMVPAPYRSGDFGRFFVRGSQNIDRNPGGFRGLGTGEEAVLAGDRHEAAGAVPQLAVLV